MNNSRRKELNTINDRLFECVYAVEGIRDEEQEAYNNLPEGLQVSETGERIGNALAELESAINSIEDAMDALKNAAE